MNDVFALSLAVAKTHMDAAMDKDRKYEKRMALLDLAILSLRNAKDALRLQNQAEGQ